MVRGAKVNRYENMTPDQAIAHLREHIHSVCYPMTTAMCAEMIKMIERQEYYARLGQAAEKAHNEAQDCGNWKGYGLKLFNAIDGVIRAEKGAV